MARGVRLVLMLLFCATSSTAQTDLSRVGLLLFKPGTKTLTAQTKEQLAGLKMAMYAYPSDLVILLPAKNDEISQQQVLTVRSFLIKDYKIDSTRIIFGNCENEAENDRNVVLFRMSRKVLWEEARSCIPLGPVRRKE